MDEEETLRSIRTKLGKVFEIQRMVLFGSRARGDSRPDSDFDILVVAETSVPFIERQGMGLLALGKRDFALDLMIFTPAEFERGSGVLGSAIYWAQHEGRVIYAK